MRSTHSKGTNVALAVRRSVALWIGAVLLGAAFVAVIGRGVEFAH